MPEAARKQPVDNNDKPQVRLEKILMRIGLRSAVEQNLDQQQLWLEMIAVGTFEKEAVHMEMSLGDIQNPTSPGHKT